MEGNSCAGGCAREGAPARKKQITQYYMVASEHLNGSKRLFGGQLMAWMDITSGILGRLYAGKNIITRAVRDMVFEAPAFLNDIVVLDAEVVRVGNTSMTIQVCAFAQNPEGERTHINTAQFVLVALDEYGRPTPVGEGL